MRIFRCTTKILQGVSSEAANSHYGQQRVDVTEGKTDKKILGKRFEANWSGLALIRFSRYVNQNGQQSKGGLEA